MRIPVTEALVDYLHATNLTVKELERRGGIPAPTVYRILRRDVSVLNEENSKALAKGLRISEEKLLDLAMSSSDMQADKFRPPELAALIEQLDDAWSDLCDAQKFKLIGYVECLVSTLKNKSEMHRAKKAV